MRNRKGRHIAVALLHLTLALWVMRNVRSDPSNFLASPSGDLGPIRGVVESDMRWTTWSLTRVAHTLLTDPRALFDTGGCFPMPHPVTLGEHLTASGLIGVLPFALTGDPVVTANVVGLLNLWLLPLAMYALVLHHTGQTGAALVASLLVGFHPQQTRDFSMHPFIHAHYWTLGALLFASRLLARPAWSSAFGLALMLTMATLESVYVAITAALVGAAVGSALLLRHRRNVRRALPMLLAVAALIGGVLVQLFGPYARTRAVWGVLDGRGSFGLFPGDLWFPGALSYLGTCLLALTALGLLDRLRGPRGVDVRLGYLLGGLIVVWAVQLVVPVPWTTWHIASLTSYLSAVIPGFDAVRGIRMVRIGVLLTFGVVAGYGVAGLLEGRRRLIQVAIVGLLLTAAAAERFWGPLSRWGFGHRNYAEAWAVRPSPAARALYDELPPGPVLDLPLSNDLIGRVFSMTYYLLLSAYHHHPVAACANSFRPGTLEDVIALTDDLSPPAADALAAIGFRTIVWHRDVPDPSAATRQARLAALVRDGHLAPLQTTSAGDTYALTSPTLTTAALPAAPAPDEPVHLAGARGQIPFRFHNPSQTTTYRHPDPIEPSPVRLRWDTASGTTIAEEDTGALLPIALGPGVEQSRSVAANLPAAAGTYRVSMRRREAPDTVLASALVVIEGAGMPGSRP